VLKICDAFSDSSEQGSRVVEIGPGMGALTRVLVKRYPQMTAVEIDQRAVAFLGEKLPDLKVLHQDVLQVDWPQMAADRRGKLSVVANLPYYITSQVLFSLADAYLAIDVAVVTMQLEVAERICAQPRTKSYGIPSVVFQLYGATKMNFKIPPTVFYPVPKVDSALVTIDFTKPHADLHTVEGDHLRKVVTMAFRQRRKMMRASLRGLLESEGLTMPEEWGTLRPEALAPPQFIQLTKDIYGEKGSEKSNSKLRIQGGGSDSSKSASSSSSASIPTASASPKGRLLGRALIRKAVAVDLEEVVEQEQAVAIHGDSDSGDSGDSGDIGGKAQYVSDAVWRKALFEGEGKAALKDSM
jgi:16S rRNA (adenine1518-N6/adenine1519-N6)-dimethyltransferase